MLNNMVLDPNSFKKSNILIDMRRSEIFKVFSEYEHKLLNSLLYLYSQKTKIEIEKAMNNYHEISLSKIRELMNLSSKNDYKKIILNSLTKMRDFGFNAKYQGSIFYTSFVYEFNLEQLLQLTQKDKNQTIKIKFNTSLFDCILQKNDFTLLNININKLNSKYAMNVYQIIKMKQKQINPQTKSKITTVSYNLKELNEIFDTKHKYISLFNDKIKNRKELIIKKELIKTKFDFIVKKDCITFTFRNLNRKGDLH